MHKFGGISNCFVQLVKNFTEEIEYEIAVCESDNIHLRESGLVSVDNMRNPPEKFILNKHFKGQIRFYNKFSEYFPQMTSLGRNRLKSIEALKRGDYDVFHPTFYDDYFLPYLGKHPFVLSIYDMISEHFFPYNDFQSSMKRKLVKSASHIMAISEKTKEDIIDFLHVPEDKITVIYLGSPDVPMTSIEPIISGDYLLFVGNREGYKNFRPMIRDVAPVLKRHNNLKMVCTGVSFTKDEINIFKSLGIKDKMIHFHPSDGELRNLYANALCFIFPSLYEGFGIPILEAWQSKCPVLLNKKSCFPEIAQDAAIYFTLDNMTSNLEGVLESFLHMTNMEKENLIMRQSERLTFFSWKKSAEQLIFLYNKVM